MKPDSEKREFLKGLGLLIGSTAAVQITAIDKALAVAAAYTPREDFTDTEGQEFTRKEMNILRVICDHVIPRTTTPGAVDVDAHGFVDNQLAHCYDKKDRRRAHDALSNVDARANAEHGRRFTSCSRAQQVGILDDVEQGRKANHEGEIWALKFVKGLIAFGYFTSEAGATKELVFDPYPGGFKGSVPYASIGRSWFRS